MDRGRNYGFVTGVKRRDCVSRIFWSRTDRDRENHSAIHTIRDMGEFVSSI
jgi:hypothetical protein